MDENRMKYENRTKTGMKLGKQDESKILISPSFYSLGGKKNHFFSPPDILYIYLLIRASLVVQMVKNHLQCGRLRFHSWVRKIPWRREWQPTPVFLPGESQEQRSLAGYSPWGRRVRHDWANNTVYKMFFSEKHSATTEKQNRVRREKMVIILCVCLGSRYHQVKFLQLGDKDLKKQKQLITINLLIIKLKCLLNPHLTGPSYMMRHCWPIPFPFKALSLLASVIFLSPKPMCFGFHKPAGLHLVST